MPAVKTPRPATRTGARKTTAATAKPGARSASRSTPRTATNGTAKKPARTTAKRPAKTGPAPKAAASSAKAPAAPKRNPRIPRPKGLEVNYSGHIFRSRLEARWAVLLDLLAIDYDYEVCFYRVGDGLTYLPDFYLPGQDLWLEVKGPAFLDAASMAKCLASVAGPAPLPSRSAPYAPSGRLMLGGPFLRPGLGRQVHTLISRDAAGRAALSYATFDASGTTPVGTAWDTVAADGVKKARRPAAARLQALLEPAQAALPMDESVRAAYRFAATMAFDDASKTVSPFNDRDVMDRLSRRRAGRPLGLAA
ncbi:hypothetical protein [Pseudarthrobacter sp. AB1]|uniref:hypothetical protein n=1 Tax=Pseudarthrobacter sp. AB1 TaxID=2138309 RepID=UPI00186B5CD5|nr:hypothetical protein [Pseudarthrobacter sp. AB1]MBE4719504.1 hypothetical protein [Pseudarthrobacter sp. AB1]